MTVAAPAPKARAPGPRRDHPAVVSLLALVLVGVFGGIGLLLIGLGSFERWLFGAGHLRRPRRRKGSPSIDAAAS